MSLGANQPSCGKCTAPLPWTDVDRGFGTCKSCGSAFDFSIPETPPMSERGGAPVSQPLPKIAAHKIPLPPSRIPRPGAVRVAESPTGFVVAWNKVGIHEQLVIGTAVASAAIVVISLVKKDAIAAGIFLLVGVIATFAALRARVAGNGIALSGTRLISDEGPEVAASEVTGFHCEDGEPGKGAAIVACVRDQRFVTLVTNIEERAIAVYVTQLLIERVLNSPSRSRT